MWTYRCTVIRVVDGDSLILDVDLGFHIRTQLWVRLMGIDTPELRSRDENERLRAQEAKAAVENWVAHYGPQLLCTTAKADGFGRWLAVIESAQGDDLTSYLLSLGYPPYQ